LVRAGTGPGKTVGIVGVGGLGRELYLSQCLLLC
jgi:D-arabinose 1-dehydrogenase-like Zn-dependent alcohol dehydrogenase